MDGGAPNAPTLAEVLPSTGSVLGGATVELRGAHFTGVARVTWGGVQVDATANGTGTALTLVAPPRAAPGPIDLVVTNAQGNSATFAAAFEYLLRLGTGASIVVDGLLSDWPSDAFIVGASDVVSAWGDGNVLRGLRVAYDATTLYIAVTGRTERTPNPNALVLYLDKDFGAGTGIAHIAALTDSTGALDNACSSGFDARGVAGFGAEFCVGTWGMSAISTADGFPATDKAGLRDITVVDNFGYAVDAMARSLVTVAVNETAPGAVEFAIPLTALYPAGVPTGGARLALFARITNPDGTLSPNHSLPQETSATPFAVTQVAVISLK